MIDFGREVAGATETDKAVVAGNSIGALAALYAAARAPEQTLGLCLVNSAAWPYTSPLSQLHSSTLEVEG